MPPATLALVAVVQLAVAGVFCAVAVRVAARGADRGDRLAARAHGSWWGGMAGVVGLQAIVTVVVVEGFGAATLYQVVRFANGLLLGLATWGLVFHVVYLYSGRTALAWAVAPVGLAIAVLYMLGALLHPVVAVLAAPLEVTPVFEPPLDGTFLWTATILVVGVPLLLACAGYLFVVRQLVRREQKRRALLASVGILVWVAAGMVVQTGGAALANFVVYTGLACVAAVMVLVAHFQPRWMRRGDAPVA